LEILTGKGSIDHGKSVHRNFLKNAN